MYGNLEGESERDREEEKKKPLQGNYGLKVGLERVKSLLFKEHRVISCSVEGARTPIPSP